MRLKGTGIILAASIGLNACGFYDESSDPIVLGGQNEQSSNISSADIDTTSDSSEYDQEEEGEAETQNTVSNDEDTYQPTTTRSDAYSEWWRQYQESQKNNDSYSNQTTFNPSRNTLSNTAKDVNALIPVGVGTKYSSPLAGSNQNYKTFRNGRVEVRNGSFRWKDLQSNATYKLCDPNQPKTSCDNQRRAWGFQGGSCRAVHADDEC